MQENTFAKSSFLTKYKKGFLELYTDEYDLPGNQRLTNKIPNMWSTNPVGQMYLIDL